MGRIFASLRARQFRTADAGCRTGRQRLYRGLAAGHFGRPVCGV